MTKSTPNIVVIGGGNGTGVVLSSLKNSAAKLSAIVSMADDGGSTGRLREETGSSAVGDIRQCLTTLAESETSKSLFSYRFADGALEGHSFGNIFLSSAEKFTGSLYKAINLAKNLLDVKENIVPVTDAKPRLVAKAGDQKINGVYEFAKTAIEGKKVELKLTPKSEISGKAETLIGEADLIIIAPGNFYCSILPALIVEGMSRAIKKSKAKKVFVANIVNFNNHTENYKLEDYLSEISRITGLQKFDYVIANNDFDSLDSDLVKLGDNESVDNIVSEKLISKEKVVADPNDKIAQIRSNIKHDKATLNKLFTQILKG